MMNQKVEANFLSLVEDNDGDTDNYATCPLLQLKYTRPRRPITNRLGQKSRYFKCINDNQPLFENKTAEADLGNSFKIRTPKKLTQDLEKLDLLHETPFVRQVVNTQHDSDVESQSDTFANLNRNTVHKLHFKPILPLSTKRLLYSNEDNLPKQTKEELNTLETRKLTQSSIIKTTSSIFTIKENVEKIAKKSPINMNDVSCFASPEISRHSYDSNLYHTVRETTTIPRSSCTSFSLNNLDSIVNLSLSTERLECRSINNQPKNYICEQSSISNPDTSVINIPSPTHIPVQERELKQAIHPMDNKCLKCINENFITVKEINYKILNTLGHGGSSTVYEVLHPDNNKVVAIKKVDLSEVDNIIAKGYLNEVNLLQNLQDCENVIRLFDSQYTTKEKILYMVMEKGDTDLSKLIRSTKCMSIHMIMYYWSEMLTTVNEIHNKGVIHSDLKPANFLLVSGRLKLIDFGIASKIQGDMTSVMKDVTTGTWNYMSPECIRSGSSNFPGHKINQKSDVWSLGCILYSLIYGKTPYSHLTNTWQKLQAIAESKQNINFPCKSKIFTQGIPFVLKQTMELCLIKDVKARPVVIDLLRLIENTVFNSNL